MRLLRLLFLAVAAVFLAFVLLFRDISLTGGSSGREIGGADQLSLASGTCIGRSESRLLGFDSCMVTVTANDNEEILASFSRSIANAGSWSPFISHYDASGKKLGLAGLFMPESSRMATATFYCLSVLKIEKCVSSGSLTVLLARNN